MTKGANFMAREVIVTTKAPRPRSPIAQGTKAGGFLYTAGLIGRSVDGTLAEGMEAQSRQVFESIKAIVEAGGGTLRDIMRCEVYVTDIKQMPIFNEVWKEYFSEDPPARIGMEVSALGPGALVEVTATAYIGS
jgi:aminoacrylate peracid reductase